MKYIIYTLKDDKGKSILDIGLTDFVRSVSDFSIQVDLPHKRHFINKREFLNTMKIFDDGTSFFLICNKSVSREAIFFKLMSYAIEKVDKRIEKLLNAKERYEKELTAA